MKRTLTKSEVISIALRFLLAGFLAALLVGLEFSCRNDQAEAQPPANPKT